MKTIFNILDRRRPVFIWWFSVLSVVFVCYAIILLDGYVDFSPMLVISVVLASWYGNSKAGLFLALVASGSLYITRENFVSNVLERAPPIYDTIIILFSLLFIAVIVTNFRKIHGVEALAADTDSLTGVHSSRSFYAELANEILRSNRYKHTFSLAYVDIDNFKNINDTLGHSTGDNLLIEVSSCLLSTFRTTDTVARIGGDEFVCLMPETEKSQARSAVLKAQLSMTEAVSRNDWDVSFSVGVVTFEKSPEDVREAVKVADELMYSVKNNNKDDIAYEVWHGNA
jgi:diguanylate cyclase (GGDEF)-like protein